MYSITPVLYNPVQVTVQFNPACVGRVYPRGGTGPPRHGVHYTKGRNRDV